MANELTTPFADICPPLSTEEFDRLKADIQANGVQQPVLRTPKGIVLDGHNRLKIDPDAPTRVVKGSDKWSMERQQAFVIHANDTRRNLSPEQRAELKKKKAALAVKLRDQGMAQAEMSVLLGVPRRTISHWIEDISSGQMAKTNTPKTGRTGRKTGAPTQRMQLSSDDKAEIVKRAAKGDPQGQVAADYGITQPRVSQLVAKAEKEQEKAKAARQEAKRLAKERVKAFTVIQGDMLQTCKSVTGIDLVIADPPYGVTDWVWDQFDAPEKFLQQCGKWIDAVRKCVNADHHIMWFCSPRFAADIEMLFRKREMVIQSRCVWHRRNMAMGSDSKAKFIDSWEMILHSGTCDLNFPAEWNDERFDVQTFAAPQTNFTDAKLHPTQKPLALIQWLVNYGSRPGGRVLDPFAGSGTTGAACDGSRECVLIEKDSEYVKVINTRLGL